MGSGLKLGWRLFWGLLASGLVGAILTGAAPGLGIPLVIGIALASGILVAIFGPSLLEVLALWW